MQEQPGYCKLGGSKYSPKCQR